MNGATMSEMDQPAVGATELVEVAGQPVEHALERRPLRGDAVGLARENHVGTEMNDAMAWN
ncbi:hypothetical protein KBX06_06040 [Micromonospora sp. C31]|uniref:hypothetical protein n=1 Tax=Micromonospora sp. C31 TaxID=2824876 RepID=UPI001B37CE73|nr:hypothetical protein [Micromonospora sp. C31]MBQ1072728.1 hypothetical protein [Micromonospora sp. C31]